MTTKVSPKSPKKGSAVDQYNQVVEGAQLRDIRLVDLDFKIKPEYYSAFFEKGSEEAANKKFDCDVTDLHYDAKNRILGGKFSWHVSVFHSRKKLLKIKTSYLIIYSDVPSVETEHSFAFLSKVGRFATYPYFRSMVSQISWSSRANLPTMPVIK